MTKIAASNRSSAFADLGDFMKMVSVQLAGMSAFSFFEPSLSTYSVEKLFFQAAKNNLSLLGKFYFEGCKGSPILSDRSLWNL